MATLNLETLLAIDCAASACSVAVFSGRKCLANRFELMARGQSEKLVPMIDGIMGEAGLEYTELSAVAVSVGPGSFTGLRIAISTAKGISLATGAPVVGLNTLQLMAYGAISSGSGESDTAPDREILAVLDTKRGDIYAQRFSGKCEPLGAPAAMSVDEIIETMAGQTGPLAIVGDAGDEIFDRLKKAGRSDVARLKDIFAPDAAMAGPFCAVHPDQLSDDVSPLYIRPPEAKLPKEKRG